MHNEKRQRTGALQDAVATRLRAWRVAVRKRCGVPLPTAVQGAVAQARGACWEEGPMPNDQCPKKLQIPSRKGVRAGLGLAGLWRGGAQTGPEVRVLRQREGSRLLGFARFTVGDFWGEREEGSTRGRVELRPDGRAPQNGAPIAFYRLLPPFIAFPGSGRRRKAEVLKTATITAAPGRGAGTRLYRWHRSGGSVWTGIFCAFLGLKKHLVTLCNGFYRFVTVYVEKNLFCGRGDEMFRILQEWDFGRDLEDWRKGKLQVARSKSHLSPALHHFVAERETDALCKKERVALGRDSGTNCIHLINTCAYV